MEKELSEIESETREEISKDDLAAENDSEKEFDNSAESKDVEEEKELNLGTLLEIVSGIKKVTIPSGIKHV
jgi:hypothetical protein